jgi:DNA-binding SARP family transcriptional activator/tetratricopeptide (TPR) repeat protein
MQFGVLGPVEIRVGQRTLDAGHARQRAVLAALLLDLGHVVPVDRLIDRVWGERPPAAVRNALYGYIARLRAIIASAAEDGVTLSRRQSGYVLQADPEQLDLYRFRGLARKATAAASDSEASERLLREALGLWHGAALAGLDSPWLNAMRDTLELERHAALLDQNDIRLRLGQHSALAAELVSQATAAPDDERLIGQLMLALYRCGRQADALRWFEQTRRYLADELGTDPAPQLQELHQQILRAEPTLTLATPAATGEPGGLAPRELPADVAPFTGRAAELAELERILLGQTGRTGDVKAAAALISAISGTAGVGKTALAVHWAHRAASHFPDGQLYVNLRGYDPDQPMAATEALAGFLRSLGVPGQDIPAAEAERAARYRSLLAGKRILIVLDNAGTAEQVRPLLPGHSECRAVITSRDSLAGLVARDGARRLDLDLLPAEDAVALLCELIGEPAAANPAAVTALAHQCARLPLALRIAAELAAARPATPLPELVAELSDQQRRLDLLHADGDPRTAVRAVLSWSYEHLDHDGALAFRLLGLHPGADFDAYALAALARSTLEHARQALDTASRAHLIQTVAPSRYGMHDLLRAYAREQAVAGDTDGVCHEALTRLFDYYLSTAAKAMDTLFPADAHNRQPIQSSAVSGPAMPGKDDARAWLDQERANLVQVAVYSAAHSWPAHATGLAGTLFRYLLVGSHLPEAHTIYSHALQAARRSRDPVAEARALNGLGSVGTLRGHFRDATDYYRAALELYRRSGDRARQANVLRNLGLLELELHNPQSAAHYHRQALAAFNDAGDSLGQAHALSDLADAEIELGSYDQAEEHLRSALGAVRAADDQPGEADALVRFGDLNLRRGQLTQAADLHIQALAIFRRLENPAAVANALRSLGDVSVRKGEHHEAISYFRLALETFRQAGGQAGEAVTLRSLAGALRAAGQPGAARAELARGLRLAAQAGNSYQQASAHCGLADCHYSADQVEQARHHWQQALTLYTEIGAPEADEVGAHLAALSDEAS